MADRYRFAGPPPALAAVARQLSRRSGLDAALVDGRLAMHPIAGAASIARSEDGRYIHVEYERAAPCPFFRGHLDACLRDLGGRVDGGGVSLAPPHWSHVSVWDRLRWSSRLLGALGLAK